MKKLFLFFAVALVLPLATALNCTNFTHEKYDICRYIDDIDCRESLKEDILEEMLEDDVSINGDFGSILGKEFPDIVQLNDVEDEDFELEDKDFLINLSSISLFGYILYSFFKKYHLLINFL